MRVLMVTPHLPPDQAANALLPDLLGRELLVRGHDVSFIAFAPRYGRADRQSNVRYLKRPSGNGWARRARLSHLATLLSLLSGSTGDLRSAQVVHLHSNTFMNQAAAFLTRVVRRPFILTHYGTEIWHYKPRRAVDPFLWMNQRATHVTYYSRLLLERSLELGVSPKRPVVVYPPVSLEFAPADPEGRESIRREWNIGPSAPLLLNVKRLHPLAGQRTLIEAMPRVLARHTDARLLIAGEGESRGELEALIQKLGLSRSVTLLGLVDNRELPRYYQAGDVFVLPSRLEAFPTVAAEALACGTPVVSADHPGGLELFDLFSEDVRLVPREDPEALAASILKALVKGSRVSEATRQRIEAEFRPHVAVDRYLALYQEAVLLPPRVHHA